MENKYPDHSISLLPHLPQHASSARYEAPPVQVPQLSLHKRLGTLSVITLIGGSVIVVGIASFLAFLWIAEESNGVWRDIVVSGWLTRSITLSSLILRFVAAAQGAVETSMVAAILLQASQTPLSSAAAVSIAQVQNGGPWELILHLPRGQKLRPMAIVSWILIVLLTLVLTALQFTSTALLSDVGLGTILNNEVISSLAVGATVDNMNSFGPGTVCGTLSSKYLTRNSRPQTFPAFAEYSTPIAGDPGTRDTGVSIRAFLPIASQATREATLVFNGVATLLDSRVVCVRPSVSDVEVHLQKWIVGSLWAENSVPGLTKSAGKANFNCTYTINSMPGAGINDHFYDTTLPTDSAIALCPVELDSFGLSSTLFPARGDVPYKYLVININGDPRSWLSSGTLESPLKPLEWKIGTSDEWITSTFVDPNFERKDDFPLPQVSLSLCTFDPQVRNMTITATRPSPAAEPSVSWNTTRRRYVTDSVRRQLGTANRTSIFTLASPELETALHANSMPSSIPEAGSAVGVEECGLEDFGDKDSPPLFLCWSCFNTFTSPPEINLPTGTLASNLAGDMLQDTLKETGGNIALALQGLITATFSTTYYDLLPQFDIFEPAELKTSKEVVRPIRHTFAALLGGVVVVHLILCVIVTALFATKAKHMLLGATWSAVARLFGADTEFWLRFGSGKRDSEVTKEMHAAGVSKILVGAERDVGGVVSIRRRTFQRGL
ncbi:hypothetical protein QBC43DRAFT_349765 [Cladorrhinum sp. PSN259]|nr:hypothetical protein QBC43DRAFT_349765 [Cladorrhinum sp. PSN259]